MELKPKPAGRKSRNSAKLALPDLMDNRHCAWGFCPKKRRRKKKIKYLLTAEVLFHNLRWLAEP
jgi:hypothetical protein